MQDYDSIIKNLFARHQSVQNAGFNQDSYKPGLDRIRGLDRRMGSPSTHLRFIHVAGTNGKGSVSSMLAASLSGSGYSVGLFTSPHLLDFRERIKIVSEGGFRMIPREDVLEFLDKYDSPELSFFEITTGMALWYFDRCQVDVAVLEVGLGGLLDSTNIVVPEVAVVTSIGLDHCALLGSTRAEIAGQKAGIFKAGVPAVVGETDPETAPVFEAAAAAAHCPLFFADEFSVIPGLTGDPSLSDMASQMDLTGEWQRKNLRTVLCTLDLLGEEPDYDALAHAAHITGLRGRWETVCDSPCTIADIGHNPAALKENFARLGGMMASGLYDNLLIVYGIMADKDLQGILPLMPRDAEYFFAVPDTPRALPAQDLLARFRAFHHVMAGPDPFPVMAGSDRPSETLGGAGDHFPAAQACGSVADALRRALAAASSRTLIYVGGSAFVVADCLKFLEKSKKD